MDCSATRFAAGWHRPKRRRGARGRGASSNLRAVDIPRQAAFQPRAKYARGRDDEFRQIQRAAQSRHFTRGNCSEQAIKPQCGRAPPGGLQQLARRCWIVPGEARQMRVEHFVAGVVDQSLGKARVLQPAAREALRVDQPLRGNRGAIGRRSTGKVASAAAQYAMTFLSAIGESGPFIVALWNVRVLRACDWKAENQEFAHFLK